MPNFPGEFMGYGEPDVYYQPEAFGLEIVKEVGDHGYEFDLLVLWKDKDGQFYFGQDSGCSCFSPFEEFTDLDQLDKVSCKAELQEHLSSYGYHSTEDKIALLSAMDQVAA